MRFNVTATSNDTTHYPRIATLGPTGTFSERAAQHWLTADSSNKNALHFYPSLARTLAAVPENCELAIVPIENIVEGIVSPVVDSFVRRPLQIIGEVMVPIQFAYVANHSQPERIFAQFVAQGQCSEFLAGQSAPVLTTASNSESLQQLLDSKQPAGAIVPAHALAEHHFAHMQQDVTDVAHNETRFIAVREPRELEAAQPSIDYKTAILIIDDADHPGLLVEHLQVFAAYRVNLTALVSRPTGRRFGHYHFYIECEGHAHDSSIQAALTLIQLRNRVTVLGSFPKAEQT